MQAGDTCQATCSSNVDVVRGHIKCFSTALAALSYCANPQQIKTSVKLQTVQGRLQVSSDNRPTDAQAQQSICLALAFTDCQYVLQTFVLSSRRLLADTVLAAMPKSFTDLARRLTTAYAIHYNVVVPPAWTINATANQALLFSVHNSSVSAFLQAMSKFGITVTSLEQKEPPTVTDTLQLTFWSAPTHTSPQYSTPSPSQAYQEELALQALHAIIFLCALGLLVLVCIVLNCWILYKRWKDRPEEKPEEPGIQQHTADESEDETAKAVWKSETTTEEAGEMEIHMEIQREKEWKVAVAATAPTPLESIEKEIEELDRPFVLDKVFYRGALFANANEPAQVVGQPKALEPFSATYHPHDLHESSGLRFGRIRLQRSMTIP